jgi:hydrogenase maturation protein HypF
VVRCEETGAGSRAAQFIRRARGYTPQGIRLDREYPATLALGSMLKNTICIIRGDEAFLSQHVGDLDNRPTFAALDDTVDHLLGVLQVEPAVIARDRHPDFHSSELAERIAAGRGVPCTVVQHHHAHIAAVAAEHKVTGPLLGLALDGVGLGDDKGIWGGELMWVEAVRFERLGCLVELKLPGGDAAAREPWRMAAAALHSLGRGEEIGRRFPALPGEAVREMLDRDVRCPLTSSAGRWFDAIAGLYGVKPKAAFEGQAAMLIEGLAAQHGDVDPLADCVAVTEDNKLDLRPVFARLLDIPDAAQGAALFHASLAAGLAEWVGRAAREHELGRVVLGGGCFLNRVLCRSLRRLLQARGLEVLEARQAPPNDGGVALGQAWVAANAYLEGSYECA